jgi:hypothetical protein
MAQAVDSTGSGTRSWRTPRARRTPTRLAKAPSASGLLEHQVEGLDGAEGERVEPARGAVVPHGQPGCAAAADRRPAARVGALGRGRKELPLEEERREVFRLDGGESQPHQVRVAVEIELDGPGRGYAGEARAIQHEVVEAACRLPPERGHHLH